MLIHNRYSVTYTITYKNNSHDEFKSNACFSNLFRLSDEFRKNIQSVNVMLFKKNNHNNIVIISKEQIESFLNYLKRIVKFTYTLEECNKYYNLQVKFEDFTKLQVKFLFTCIRKLFEYPYSATLYDWFLLCDKKWKKLSKLNTLYFLDFCCKDSIHGLCSYTSLVRKVSLKELKEYLKTDNEYLSDMFKFLSLEKTDGLKFLDFGIGGKIFSEAIITKNAYKKRKEIYKNIFKRLKDEGIYSR